MADRVNADGLPLPSPHMGHSEAYLHRACLLLDQVSRQLGELLYQEQAPVELVSEPAVPQPTTGAPDATAGRKSVRKTRAARTTGKDT